MHCSKIQGKNKDTKIMKYLNKKIRTDPMKWKEKAIICTQILNDYQSTTDLLAIKVKKYTGYENLHAINSIVLADRRTDEQPGIRII